ncbi:MAG: acylphosphatase [Deferribacterota bacterium]|nr:acylphosphatase [Deferribacterota bacterium]
MLTYNINVTGLVQGVNFRAYIYSKAKYLNIKGYVKNLSDGSVEIRAQGDEDSIQKLIEHAKVGPPMARVSNIKIKKEDHEKFHDFEIK